MPGHTRRHSVISWAQTAEPIEMVFGLLTGVGRRRHMLHGTHWRHLANTSEPSVCGGDAALCQITLATCYNNSECWFAEASYIARV